MANTLFNAFNNNNNPYFALIQQAKQLQRTFRGDPKAEVEKLIQSGAMTQEQFNQYSQTANHIMQIFK